MISNRELLLRFEIAAIAILRCGHRRHRRTHFGATYFGPWKNILKSSKMSFLGLGSVAKWRFRKTRVQGWNSEKSQQNFQAPIKLAQPFPAPELAGKHFYGHEAFLKNLPAILGPSWMWGTYCSHWYLHGQEVWGPLPDVAQLGCAIREEDRVPGLETGNHQHWTGCFQNCAVVLGLWSICPCSRKTYTHLFVIWIIPKLLHFLIVSKQIPLHKKSLPNRTLLFWN